MANKIERYHNSVYYERFLSAAQTFYLLTKAPYSHGATNFSTQTHTTKVTQDRCCARYHLHAAGKSGLAQPEVHPVALQFTKKSV